MANVKVRSLRFFTVGIIREFPDPDYMTFSDLFDGLSEKDPVTISVAELGDTDSILVHVQSKHPTLAFVCDSWELREKTMDFLRERELEPKHPEVWIGFIESMRQGDADAIVDGMKEAGVLDEEDEDDIYQNLSICDPSRGYDIQGPCVFVLQHEAQDAELSADTDTLEITCDGTTYKSAHEYRDEVETHDTFGMIPLHYTPYEEA